MIAWEYLEVHIDTHKFMDQLNVLGAQGWEVFEIGPVRGRYNEPDYRTVMLKRAKEVS